MPAPFHPTEEARLDVVARLALIESGPDESYDDIVDAAAGIFQAPIALISIVDRCRQWFKSRTGLAACETSRDLSFCAYTILQQEALVVEDATCDPRFSDNEFVTGDFGVRFYAGTPIYADGQPIGSLCVVDIVPRKVEPFQIQLLRTLADSVSRLLQNRLDSQDLAAAFRRQVDLQEEVRGQNKELERLALDLSAASEKNYEAASRYAGLFHNLPIATCAFDATGVVYEWNEEAAGLFGVPASEVVGLPFHDVFKVTRSARRLQIALDRVYQGKKVLPTDWSYRQGGVTKRIQSTAFPITDAKGTVTGCISAHVDVTERKRMENVLKANYERLQKIVEHLPTGAVLVRQGALTFNRYVENLTGYARTDIPDIETWFRILHVDNDTEARLAYQEAQANSSKQAVTIQFRRRDGELRHGHIARCEEEDFEVWLLHDDTSRVQFEAQLLEQIRKVNEGQALLEAKGLELEKANRKLQELSSTDSLTGLPNRRALEERLEAECSVATHHKTALSFLMIDVDWFKAYNDEFGHVAGDEILAVVGQLISTVVRPGDFVARYGGEEFAVILPQTNAEDALVVAEEIRRSFGAHDWPLRAVTLSIGCASWHQGQIMPKELVLLADRGLYTSKAGGRNRVSSHVKIARSDPARAA